MKKHFGLFLALVGILGIFSSCASTGGAKDKIVPKTANAAYLEGTWAYTTEFDIWNFEEEVWTFNKDKIELRHSGFKERYDVFQQADYEIVQEDGKTYLNIDWNIIKFSEDEEYKSYKEVFGADVTAKLQIELVSYDYFVCHMIENSHEGKVDIQRRSDFHRVNPVTKEDLLGLWEETEIGLNNREVLKFYEDDTVESCFEDFDANETCWYKGTYSIINTKAGSEVTFNYTHIKHEEKVDYEQMKEPMQWTNLVWTEGPNITKYQSTKWGTVCFYNRALMKADSIVGRWICKPLYSTGKFGNWEDIYFERAGYFDHYFDFREKGGDCYYEIGHYILEDDIVHVYIESIKQNDESKEWDDMPTEKLSIPTEQFYKYSIQDSYLTLDLVKEIVDGKEVQLTQEDKIHKEFYSRVNYVPVLQDFAPLENMNNKSYDKLAAKSTDKEYYENVWFDRWGTINFYYDKGTVDGKRCYGWNCGKFDVKGDEFVVALDTHRIGEEGVDYDNVKKEPLDQKYYYKWTYKNHFITLDLTKQIIDGVETTFAPGQGKHYELFDGDYFNKANKEVSGEASWNNWNVQDRGTDAGFELRLSPWNDLGGCYFGSFNGEQGYWPTGNYFVEGEDVHIIITYKVYDDGTPDGWDVNPKVYLDKPEEYWFKYSYEGKYLILEYFKNCIDGKETVLEKPIRLKLER